MKIELLDLLRCPKTGARLVLDSPGSASDVVDSGILVSSDGLNRYPIRAAIPRFVPESNYADNFGMQWNKFRQTQLDSFSGHPISANRFWTSTGWAEQDLQGRWLLDLGCGAGRFAEIALNAGAKVVALDYSSAVDACYANLKHHPNLHVVQGDIYSLPFAPGSFDFVYSLGVLQHTPDVAQAFASLPPMLREGGRLCVDYYAKSWRSLLLPKYWLRPITKRLPKPLLFSVLQGLVPILLPVSRYIGLLPFVGGVLKRVVPVANYYGVFPFNGVQHREWSLLDTFDWLAPQYDNPQTWATAKRWIELANLSEVEVFKSGHLVARGKK